LKECKYQKFILCMCLTAVQVVAVRTVTFVTYRVGQESDTFFNCVDIMPDTRAEHQMVLLFEQL